jgi:hypothetical protein
VVFVHALRAVLSPKPVEAELVLHVHDIDSRIVDGRCCRPIGGRIALPDSPPDVVTVRADYVWFVNGGDPRNQGRVG